MYRRVKRAVLRIKTIGRLIPLPKFLIFVVVYSFFCAEALALPIGDDLGIELLKKNSPVLLKELQAYGGEGKDVPSFWGISFLAVAEKIDTAVPEKKNKPEKTKKAVDFSLEALITPKSMQSSSHSVTDIENFRPMMLLPSKIVSVAEIDKRFRNRYSSNKSRFEQALITNRVQTPSFFSVDVFELRKSRYNNFEDNKKKKLEYTPTDIKDFLAAHLPKSASFTIGLFSIFFIAYFMLKSRVP